MDNNKPKQSNSDRLLDASPVPRFYRNMSDRIAWKQSRLYRNLNRFLIAWFIVLIIFMKYIHIITNKGIIMLVVFALIIIFFGIIIPIGLLKDKIVDQAQEEVIVENLNKIEKYKIDHKVLFTPKKIYKIIGIIFGTIFGLAVLAAILGSIIG